MNNTPLRCVKLLCNNAKLVRKRRGQSFQSDNGFIVCKIDGLYCPRCGGSYGGAPEKKESNGTR